MRILLVAKVKLMCCLFMDLTMNCCSRGLELTFMGPTQLSQNGYGAQEVLMCYYVYSYMCVYIYIYIYLFIYMRAPLWGAPSCEIRLL